MSDEHIFIHSLTHRDCTKAKSVTSYSLGDNGLRFLCIYTRFCILLWSVRWTLIARFMGPTWGPSGADSTLVGPMLAPWTLLSGNAMQNCDLWINMWYFAFRSFLCYRWENDWQNYANHGNKCALPFMKTVLSCLCQWSVVMSRLNFTCFVKIIKRKWLIKTIESIFHIFTVEQM